MNMNWCTVSGDNENFIYSRLIEVTIKHSTFIPTGESSFVNIEYLFLKETAG